MNRELTDKDVAELAMTVTQVLIAMHAHLEELDNAVTKLEVRMACLEDDVREGENRNAR